MADAPPGNTFGATAFTSYGAFWLLFWAFVQSLEKGVIGNAGAHTGIVKLGGWIGLATAFAAWYASFAEVTNATFGRVVFPTRPLRR